MVVRWSFAHHRYQGVLRGERITDWIRLHPDYEVFDKIVTQSSDAEFHCLAITLFYRPKSRRAEREVDRVH